MKRIPSLHLSRGVYPSFGSDNRSLALRRRLDVRSVGVLFTKVKGNVVKGLCFLLLLYSSFHTFPDRVFIPESLDLILPEASEICRFQIVNLKESITLGHGGRLLVVCDVSTSYVLTPFSVVTCVVLSSFLVGVYRVGPTTGSSLVKDTFSLKIYAGVGTGYKYLPSLRWVTSLFTF